LPVYAKIRKSSNSEIWMMDSKFHNSDHLDIRIWFVPDGETDWHPTKKGVSIPYSKMDNLLLLVKKLKGMRDFGPIGHIELKENRRIDIGRRQYFNRSFFEIRQYYKSDEDEWKPGRGVTFNDDHLQIIVEALETIEPAAQMISKQSKKTKIWNSI